jgi:chorismate lyase
LHRNRWLKIPIASGVYQKWLTDRGSLTLRLQQRYADMHVVPVKSKFETAWVDEAVLLHMPTRQVAIIREVFLMHDKTPLVFAHSVLPIASLRGAWLGLSRLGNKPLGAILFANRRVRRTPLSYKKLDCRDPLYVQVKAQLMQHLPANQTLNLPTELWARRSLFSLNCAKIVVTEVFLPTLL